MVLAVLAAAGFYYRERPTDTGPRPFRTTVTLTVPSPVPEEGQRDETEVVDAPDVLFRGQQALALNPSTRDAALAAAPAGDAGVGFAATVDDDQIVLTVTSEDQGVSQAVASAYATAFVEARRQLVADDLANQQRALLETVEQLRTRLQVTESDLRARMGTLPPVLPPEGSEEEGEAAPLFFSFGPEQNLDTTLLLYERNSLYTRINDAQFQLAELRVDSETPEAYAQITGEATNQAPGEETSSLLGPIGGILIAGLLLGLVGAVLVDRMDHTIRHADRASRALSAPLLSRVPSRRGRRDDATVLLRPDSSRAEAFRDLAATSVATDRLPRAIMVTTPRGDVHDDVAANFAAALANLGVRVALVATSPRQSWFLAPFTAEDGLVTFPQLLGDAHAGRLNGQAHLRMAKTELNPNLLVVPPGDNPELGLALDGLPPLLQAMTDSGIDVTVIAGPALLDDSSATIVAWATRAVLWAVQSGEVTEEELSNGAARLELAGVNAFGVAVVGAES